MTRRPPKRPAVSVRLDTYRRIAAEARRIGVSTPTVLERVITEYLDQKEQADGN